MSSRPVHASASQTLRHWTIDGQEFAAGSPRPAPLPPHSKWIEGGQFQLLASKLAHVKSALTRQTGHKPPHTDAAPPKAARAY